MKTRKIVDGLVRALAVSALMLAASASTPLLAAQESAAAPQALSRVDTRVSLRKEHKTAHRSGDSSGRILSAASGSFIPQGYLWGISFGWTDGYLWNMG